MEINATNVYGDCPLLASDGGSDRSLSFHLEVGHHHVPVQCGQVDYWTKVSCLFQHQEQPAVEPRDVSLLTLFAPLGQQGIHGLLEILAAVPGAETDALVGELRSPIPRQCWWLDRSPADFSTVGQSLPGEPPLAPRQCWLAEVAAAAVLAFLRCPWRGRLWARLTGVRRYFDPHDILTLGSKYRNDILTPLRIFWPPYNNQWKSYIFFFYIYLIKYVIISTLY